MPFLKEIKERLKTKYTGVNLSNVRIDAIAAKLEPKVTEEAQIDEQLDVLNDVLPFAEIAKQDDRVRTLEAQVKKPAEQQQEEKKPEDDKTNGNDQSKKPEDEMPLWARKLDEKIDKLYAEKTVQTIESKMFEKGKGLPEKLLRKYMPKTIEEVDNAIAECKADYEEIVGAKVKDQQEEDVEDLADNPKPVIAVKGSTSKGIRANIDLLHKRDQERKPAAT